jgi:hypothetical protein
MSSPHHQSKRRCRSKSIIISRKRRTSQRRCIDADYFGNNGAYQQPIPTPTVSTFEAYLRTENFLPIEEHNQLLRCLRSPLPINFRIRSKSSENDWKQ